ncbi:MAG: radical SAM protein [Candidatus Thermoplasmatota archaeon]
MTGAVKNVAFGPVPSRRLGQSIGINNIPPKICTYSCVYCQLGRTRVLQMARRPYYRPQEIKTAVQQKIQAANDHQESVEYLTFVADGEPTLDSNLGIEIKMLQTFGMPIAVLTNSSLLWKKDVQDDLRKTNLVSVKIDTVDEQIWQHINRPYPFLAYKDILEGIVKFAHSYNGDLVTETMLIQDVNGTPQGIKKVAEFITKLSPKRSYISIPIRPPTESWVKPPTEDAINRAFQIFKEYEIDTEYLIGYEGNRFAYTGNLEEDLLGIMSVHPIREDGVRELLLKANAHWSIIETLLLQQKVIKREYNGKKFYMRTFPGTTQGS